MRKTILKNFTENTKTSVVILEIDAETEQLKDLVQEMNPYLAEAAADLLQPRPQALAELFRKALH